MAERQLATIWAIDAVGYGGMMRPGAADLPAALSTVFHAVVKPNVADKDGRMVELLGDGEEAAGFSSPDLVWDSARMFPMVIACKVA